jgi:hypothetical protein
MFEEAKNPGGAMFGSEKLQSCWLVECYVARVEQVARRVVAVDQHPLKAMFWRDAGK